MAKLCAKGKAAAKRKFRVYPSAYANMYASGVCSGKITPGGKRERKVDGGEVGNRDITKKEKSIFKVRPLEKNMPSSVRKQTQKYNAKVRKYNELGIKDFEDIKIARKEGKLSNRLFRAPKTKFKASGGRITMKSGGMTRPMYKGGGKIEEFGKRIIKGIGKASGLTGPSLARKKFKESVKKDRTKKAKGGLIKGQGCEIR